MAAQVPFEFWMYDFLSGDFLGAVPLNNPTWSSVLNSTGSTGSLSGTIDLADPRIQALNPQYLTAPGRTAVFVNKGGYFVWGGVSLPTRPFTRSTRLLTYTATDFWGYLSRRVQATDYSAPPYSGITGTSSTMPIWNAAYQPSGGPPSEWDPMLMCAQVIYDALSVPYGNPLGGMNIALNGFALTSTGTVGGALYVNSYLGVTTTCTTLATSTTLTGVLDTTAVVPGMSVISTAIPPGTVVMSVPISTQVVISAEPYTSGAGVAVTFGGDTATPTTDYVNLTFPYASPQYVATIVNQITALGYTVGPDVGVDIGTSINGTPVTTINLAYPQRGRQASDNELAVNVANAWDYTVTPDATTLANTIYETGGSGDIVVSQNVTPFTQGFALFESVINHSQILSAQIPTILARVGLGDLLLSSYPPVTFSVVCDLWGADPAYGSFIVGDVARLMIDPDEMFPLGLDADWRITGVSVNLPDEGGASMTLSLSPPLPASGSYTGPFI